MTVSDVLESMMDTDPVLYERIMDTPGFAVLFNTLCVMANHRGRAELLAAAIDAVETYEREGAMGSAILRIRDAVRVAINDPNWMGTSGNNAEATA